TGAHELRHGDLNADGSVDQGSSVVPHSGSRLDHRQKDQSRPRPVFWYIQRLNSSRARSESVIRPILHVLVLLFPGLVLAGPDAPDAVAIEEVLALGPLPVDAELMAEAGHADGLRRALIGQLSEQPLPRPSQSVAAFGRELGWQSAAVDELDNERQLQLWWFQL